MKERNTEPRDEHIARKYSTNTEKRQRYVIMLNIRSFRFISLVLLFVSGNQPLKTILAQGYYELRVDLEDWEGTQIFAQYNVFDIGNFAEDYRLSVGVYSGNAGLFNSEVVYKLRFGCIYSILSNTITLEVVGAPQMTSQHYLSTLTCFQLP